MDKGRTLSALLVGFACCGPAAADIDGKAQLANLGFMLADLAPDDGIAPGLTFMPDPWAPHAGSVYMTYSERLPGGADVVSYADLRTSQDSRPLALEYGWQQAAVGAALDRRDEPLQQVLSIGTRMPVGARTRIATQDVDSDHLAFFVTPHTAVTFYATLAATGSVDTGTQIADGSNNFSAYGQLKLLIEQPEGWWSSDLADAELRADQYRPVLDDTAILLASMANPADAAAMGTVEMSLAGSAVSVTPIPEPAPAALFGAGAALLAGLGALRRRRPRATRG